MPTPSRMISGDWQATTAQCDYSKIVTNVILLDISSLHYRKSYCDNSAISAIRHVGHEKHAHAKAYVPLAGVKMEQGNKTTLAGHLMIAI